jgi:hypothetical protein
MNIAIAAIIAMHREFLKHSCPSKFDLLSKGKLNDQSSSGKEMSLMALILLSSKINEKVETPWK